MEDVIFSYKKNSPVLNGLTMRAPKNSICAILGHNGAGKTTLLRHMGKLIKLRSGKMAWGMKDNEGIGFMPEGIGLYPRLSGYDNLNIRLLAYKKNVDKKEIADILQKINLFEHADKQVGLWSTGMKRRLALACSLTAAPALLLLDEPFTGIDPASQKIMLEMIQEKSRPCAIVFSIHGLHLVKNISTGISVIKKENLNFIPIGGKIWKPLKRFTLTIMKNNQPRWRALRRLFTPIERGDSLPFGYGA
ncbi:MAG: ATP-binding cassette domain-containing protein [Treponema sp.]|nr:ATP-binding cassette domain-containing protein [Treponema sp.]